LLRVARASCGSCPASRRTHERAKSIWHVRIVFPARRFSARRRKQPARRLRYPCSSVALFFSPKRDTSGTMMGGSCRAATTRPRPAGVRVVATMMRGPCAVPAGRCCTARLVAARQVLPFLFGRPAEHGFIEWWPCANTSNSPPGPFIKTVISPRVLRSHHSGQHGCTCR